MGPVWGTSAMSFVTQCLAFASPPVSGLVVNQAHLYVVWRSMTSHSRETEPVRSRSDSVIFRNISGEDFSSSDHDKQYNHSQ